MQRPYKTESVEAIRLLAVDHWSSVNVLATLCAELEHRSTHKAFVLARELQERLALLNNQRGSQRSREKVSQHYSRGTGSANGHADSIKIAELQKEIEQYKEEIRILRENNAKLEDRLARNDHDRNIEGERVLFGRVGLSPKCPSFVFEATVRAYRKKFHPDLHKDPANKRRAEETLKEAEKVFHAIRPLLKDSRT